MESLLSLQRILPLLARCKRYFFAFFQASEGKNEVSEARHTRGMGKGAFHYRFVLYSPEKGEEIASIFVQSKSFIESHKNRSKRALCTLCGFVE